MPPTREEQVISRLRGAFPAALYDATHMSREALHEKYRDMRIHLPALYTEDLLEVLPLVLEDLVYTHTGHAIITDDIENVIGQLNGNDDDLFLRKAKRDTYQDFSPQQAEAILAWLLLAREWPDLSLCREWVDQAIAYWRSRTVST